MAPCVLDIDLPSLYIKCFCGFSADLNELDLQIQAAQRIEDDLKIQYSGVLCKCAPHTLEPLSAENSLETDQVKFPVKRDCCFFWTGYPDLFRSFFCLRRFLLEPFSSEDFHCPQLTELITCLCIAHCFN